MIHTMDPDDFIRNEDGTKNGIERGKVFTDFQDAEEYINKVIDNECVEDIDLFLDCIKQILPLFKKM